MENRSINICGNRFNICYSIHGNVTFQATEGILNHTYTLI